MANKFKKDKKMKINTKKILLLATLSVAPLMASESFGGIGVSIYQSRDGVKIAEIIPGTPAAESNLQAMSSSLSMGLRSRVIPSRNRRRCFGDKKTSRLKSLT